MSCSSSGWRATSSMTTSWAASSTLPAIWLSAGGGAGPYPLRRGGCGHQLRASGYIRYITDEIKKAIGTRPTPIRPAVSMSGTVCRRSKRACASMTSRRKRACGSSVRCTTSRTAASNSCKELPALRRNGPFPDRERAVFVFDNRRLSVYTNAEKAGYNRRTGQWYR